MNKHTLDREVTLPKFREFRQPGKIRFLIFRFHGYFDGLLGLDILTQLGAKVDLANQTLITKNAIIPLQFKPNFMSKKYKIPPNSKFIVELPVDVQFGDVYIKKTEINPNINISEGLYHVRDWYSLIEVTNSSNIEQDLFIEQPIKAESFSPENFTEINNFNIHYNHNTEPPSDILKLLRTDHLNQEEVKALAKVCREHEDIFFREGQKLTFTNKIKHQIRTTDDIPIYTKSYRYPYIHKEEVRHQITDMLNQGIIRPSFSPWSSPIWVVPKKRDASGKQKWRLVIDYRKLNEKTISDRYPIPNITEILDKLGKCNYFSTLDLASGFHQLEMDPRDIEKTAFTVEGGHFEYVRMPFGLKNAPSTFQRVMDNVLKELQGTVCLVYLDDIIVYSTSLQEHVENLKKVFQKLREANLKVQIDKSEFLRKEIDFLGHVVTTEGIKPNPAKIHVIKEFPIPKSQKEIKSFLGLLGYYRKFIKDFAKLTKPLTQCLKKGKSVKLTNEYIKAFENCKDLLINDPILQFPDFSKPFVLTTDASNFAIGAILSQGPIGNDKPVCYASRTLTDSEINYSTIEKELLAIVWAAKYFRPYLFGRKFQIITDHKPLTWIMSLKDPNSRLVRWRLKLEEFEYEIIYRKGNQNLNADALSRIKQKEPHKTELHLTEDDVAPRGIVAETTTSCQSINGSSIHSIHSADENMDDGIPISERPLNEFSLQLILEESNQKPQFQLMTLFKNKQRRTIRIPDHSEPTITGILKRYLAPNRLTAIYTGDEIFKSLQSTYSKFFSQSKLFKLIRCTEVLEDITDNDKQDQIIQDYHNNNNHRGINETLLHLKRDYFFPFMKNKIGQVINNCQVCQTCKYDRDPPKVKFIPPEIPNKPLDILHVDVYSINSQQILTIIDKFSKFAAAYTLNARNSLSIIKSIKHYISLHGIPRKLVADSGSEFTSTIFRDFCKQLGTNLHITSIHQSTSNSPVERLHSTLTEIYRIIHNRLKDRDHEEILNETLITYNNSIHSSTKFTPFEIFYGRTYKFNKQRHENFHEYLDKLNEFQDKFFPMIKSQLEQKATKNIEKLNKDRSDPAEIQERTNIYFKENRRNKLTPRFSKHKVRKNRHITVITTKNKKFHKSKIKKKRKFQDNSPDSGTNDRNSRLDQQQGHSSNENRTSQND